MIANLKYFTLISVFIVSCYSTAKSQENITNPNGYNKFYYPNGTLSSEGYMKDNKPDKYWKTYFPTGKLKSEGNRKAFLLDSIWIFYNEFGDTTQKINYVFGKKSGYSCIYFPSSHKQKNTVSAKELFVDDVKQGIAYYYFSNGVIKSMVTFLDNRKHGKAREFDENGNIIFLLEYRYDNLVSKDPVNRIDKNGLKQGYWVSFYPDGKLKSEEFYKDGKLNGYVKEFNEIGKIIKSERYIDNSLVVVSSNTKIETKQIKNTDGSLKTGGYQNEKPVGVHKHYSKDGKLIESELFDSTGVLLSKGIVDEKGLKQGEWINYTETGLIKSKGSFINDLPVGQWEFFFIDGSLEQKGTYVKGKPNGLWQWYYPNGIILRTEEFVNGMEDGLYCEFNLNGDTIVKGQFVDGEKNGYWFYKIGDVFEEGKYLNNFKNGDWTTFYYPEMTIKHKGRFLNGEAQGEHKYYYKNKKLKERGEYINSQRVGNWLYYDETGLLLVTINFQMNEINKIDGKEINKL